MQFEYDPERLIEEIRKRPGIWDFDHKDYKMRATRNSLWGEVVSELIQPQDIKLTKGEKRELVVNLQKKWKHLRDYYIRERKKGNLEKGVRKRKNPFVDMLSFLKFMEGRSVSDSDSNVNYSGMEYDEANSDDEDDDDRPHNQIENVTLPQHCSSPLPVSFSSSSEWSDLKTTNMTPFEKSLLNVVEKSNQSVEDPDKNFLLSLLPEVKSMDEKQKFNFKYEVMSLIKKMKYSDDQPSTSKNHFFE